MENCEHCKEPKPEHLLRWRANPKTFALEVICGTCFNKDRYPTRTKAVAMAVAQG